MNKFKGLMSSKTGEWETPQELFDKLDKEFHFDLDPCATKENAKCEKFFTKKEDGLKQSWREHTVFMNPSYGREISKWVKKAYFEAKHWTCFVIALLPARTAKWFHDYIYKKAEIRFLKGRLKFSNSKNSAPFPSMVVIFNE